MAARMLATDCEEACAAATAGAPASTSATTHPSAVARVSDVDRDSAMAMRCLATRCSAAPALRPTRPRRGRGMQCGTLVKPSGTGEPGSHALWRPLDELREPPVGPYISRPKKFLNRA